MGVGGVNIREAFSLGEEVRGGGSIVVDKSVRKERRETHVRSRRRCGTESSRTFIIHSFTKRIVCASL